MTKLKNDDRRHHGPSIDADTHLRILEGYVRIGLAVFIVLFVVGLIVFDPQLSSKAQVWTQSLLAFALAALMASMAGSLVVEGKVAGLVVRGAAGFAVFLIAWFTLPKIVPALEVRPQAGLTLQKWGTIDFRTYDDPASPRGLSADGAVAITVPLRVVAASAELPAQPGVVESGILSFTVAGRQLRMPWLWFVTHNRKSGDPSLEWLSANGRQDVEAVPVEVSRPLFREVMFQTSASQLAWRDLVLEVSKGECPADLKLTWHIASAGQREVVELACPLDCKSAADEVNRHYQSTKGFPHRLGVSCQS